jgi:hypothetical protein
MSKMCFEELQQQQQQQHQNHHPQQQQHHQQQQQLQAKAGDGKITMLYFTVYHLGLSPHELSLYKLQYTLSLTQFHQHFMRSFFTNFLAPKNRKAKL